MDEMWWDIAVVVHMVDFSGHSVGVVVPDGWRKWTDTDGYWCWGRAIHGTSSELHRSESTGILRSQLFIIFSIKI